MNLDETTFGTFVGAQAAEMIVELQAHEDEKGGAGAWIDGDPMDWLGEADRHLGEVSRALRLCQDLDSGEAIPEDLAQAIRKHTAHACNFLMMARQTAIQDVK